MFESPPCLFVLNRQRLRPTLLPLPRVAPQKIEVTLDNSRLFLLSLFSLHPHTKPVNHWSPAAAEQRSHQLPPWSAPHWSGRWGSQQAAQLVSPQMVSATWKGAAEGERESAAAAALSPPSPLHLPFSSPARKAPPPTGKPASITHSRQLFRRQMLSTEWQ